MHSTSCSSVRIYYIFSFPRTRKHTTKEELNSTFAALVGCRRCAALLLYISRLLFVYDDDDDDDDREVASRADLVCEIIIFRKISLSSVAVVRVRVVNFHVTQQRRVQAKAKFVGVSKKYAYTRKRLRSYESAPQRTRQGTGERKQLK